MRGAASTSTIDPAPRGDGARGARTTTRVNACRRPCTSRADTASVFENFVVWQLAESVTLGTAIISALNGQRRLPSVPWADAAVADVMDDSSAAMVRMNRRVTRTNLFWAGIAVALVVAIVLVSWLKWGLSSGGRTGSGADTG